MGQYHALGKAANGPTQGDLRKKVSPLAIYSHTYLAVRHFMLKIASKRNYYVQ